MPGAPRDPSARPVSGVTRGPARIAASSLTTDAAASGVAVKRPAPLMPLLAAVVVAGVAAAAVLLVTREDDSPDPAAVVRAYHAAVRDGDCATMVDLIDTDGRPGEPEDTVESCRRAFAEQGTGAGGAELEAARLVDRAGDRAVVRVELAAPDGESGESEEAGAPGGPGRTEEVRLVRIDGRWHIDLARGGGAPPDDAGAGATP
ncbi:MAG TPA: hypothetical protein VIL48_07755 [Acidimicrobiales bacterium]